MLIFLQHFFQQKFHLLRALSSVFHLVGQHVLPVFMFVAAFEGGSFVDELVEAYSKCKDINFFIIFSKNKRLSTVGEPFLGPCSKDCRSDCCSDTQASISRSICRNLSTWHCPHHPASNYAISRPCGWCLARAGTPRPRWSALASVRWGGSWRWCRSDQGCRRGGVPFRCRNAARPSSSIRSGRQRYGDACTDWGWNLRWGSKNARKAGWAGSVFSQRYLLDSGDGVVVVLGEDGAKGASAYFLVGHGGCN